MPRPVPLPELLPTRARALVSGGAVRRGLQLVLGLLAYTLSMAMLLGSGQGAMPWDVLHEGLARTTGYSVGVVVLAVGVVVLLLWIPLRQRPGIGTVANVVIISVAIDPALTLVEGVLPAAGTTARTVVGVGLACGGVLLNGVATAAYVAAGLGPGPRDGLMTGLARRTGRSVGPVRTGIEVVVVALGWALGGTLGWATVLYALAVGPVVQVALPWFGAGRTGTPTAGARRVG